MMRVIFISHSTERSGAPLVLLSIVQHLNPDRFKPLAVFPEYGGTEEAARLNGITTQVIRNPDIGISETQGLWPRLRLLLRRLVYVWRLVGLLRRERAVIAYVNSGASIFPGIAAVIARKPICWHVHEEWLSRMKIWFIKRVARVIIFAGPSSQKSFLPRCKRALWFVIPNGIDVDRFTSARASPELYSELNLTPEDLVVTTTAMLSWRKGIDILLEAAAEVVAHFPRVRFLIIGESSQTPKAYLDTLQHLIQRHRLTRNVLLTGRRQDVSDILALSTLFVLPSRREVFPVSLIEAMAAGKPIIATDAGSVGDILDNGRCGMIVPPENPPALAKAIIQLLESADVRERLAQEARAKALREYRLDGFIHQIAHAITRTLGN